MPALALAELLRERGDEVLLLGSQRGLETHLAPAAGLPLLTFPSRQWMGYGLRQRALVLFHLLGTTLRAFCALRRYRPHILIALGGYAAVPSALAAACLRIPIVVFESNAVPGRANRLCARFARRLCCGFRATARAFAAQVSGRLFSNIFLTGTPVRRAIAAAHATARTNEPQLPLRLLVLGGSQGASQINRAIPEALEKLPAGCFEIVHQTGEREHEAVERAYHERGLAAEVIAFASDMPQRYAWADLAVCRAGALTLAELACARVPALLIPYPFAADDHQTANAREFERAGAARILPSSSTLAIDLKQALDELRSQPVTLRDMRERAASLAHPDAAQQVIAVCEDLLRSIERARQRSTPPRPAVAAGRG